MVNNKSVAVLDIGSNSIKILIATRSAEGAITPLRTHTIDARISAGISKSDPRLTEEGMARGLGAIRSLLELAAAYSPQRTVLVATSAVRDARNGAEFCARIREATGHDIRILTGEEEANLIGRGLTCDPALHDLRDFYVFDLGGGSLECLAFRSRRIEQAISLPLGCVRLSEKFVPDLTAPFSPVVASQVSRHTRDALAASGFAFSLPATAGAVGTGGTVTTVRAILGARDGSSAEQTSAIVTRAQLAELLGSLSALPLADRQKVPGLPPARADVFPTALATILALVDLGGFGALRNSVYNLRYGLAAETLDAL